jgi:hypothetical protein
MFERIKEWLFGPSLVVYIACKMTGRDRTDMVERAKFSVDVFAKYGIKAISPVLKENVPNEPGVLVNDQATLAGHWHDDKHIIRRVSHAVCFDQAEMASFGMTREYSLNRGVLWKPTVIVTRVPSSVAQFEDDFITGSLNSAAAYMATKWGSRWKRWTWRATMMNKSLLRFIVDQIMSWR